MGRPMKNVYPFTTFLMALLFIPSVVNAFICKDDELITFLEDFAESAPQQELYEKHQLFLSEDANAAYGPFCVIKSFTILNNALEEKALDSASNAFLAADALIAYSIVVFGEERQPEWTASGKAFAEDIHSKALQYVNYARDQNYPPSFILKANMFLHGIGVRKSQLNAFDQLLSASRVAEDRETQLNILEKMQILNPNHAATKAYERQLFSGAAPEEPSVAQGTGFFVSPTIVLTAAHVVAGREDITLITSESQTVSASIETLDTVNDLAVLRVGPQNARQTFLRSGSLPSLGSEITVIGYPLSAVMGDQPRLTGGIVNALHGPSNDPRLLQISAGVQAGSSGSPVLDSSGNAIGVVISKLSDSFLEATTGDSPQNINFAIKVAYALPIIDMERDVGGGDRLTRTEVVAKAENSIVLIFAE